MLTNHSALISRNNYAQIKNLKTYYFCYFPGNLEAILLPILVLLYYNIKVYLSILHIKLICKYGTICYGVGNALCYLCLYLWKQLHLRLMLHCTWLDIFCEVNYLIMKPYYRIRNGLCVFRHPWLWVLWKCLLVSIELNVC